MAPRLSWSNLFPGLIALATMIAIVVGVVLYAGVGKLRGEKMRLYVLTNQARGVMKGTEVWLAGQKVGTVEDITFRQPDADSSARVVIVVDVKVDGAEQIRRNSDVQVRSGTSLISPMVISLSAGTPNSPAARSGDTLRAQAQSDMEVAGTKLGLTMKELSPLMADARTVMSHARNPNGTVGAARTARGGTEMARLRAQVSRLRERVTGDRKDGGATAATVMSRARGALLRVDSIRALLNSNNSSFGRFRRDSTLGGTVSGVRDELTELRARLAEHEGTLSRYASDSALTLSLANAQREMTLLFDDIRRRPLRYIAF